jgi:hypothetical protein
MNPVTVICIDLAFFVFIVAINRLPLTYWAMWTSNSKVKTIVKRICITWFSILALITTLAGIIGLFK